mmetsp:Transcript_92633/g.297617  ORF Transcript_92633/g.297617 Transcript_92633/m.297617 type:complete len:261 (+) Transcript_92633:604-1386(+)
MAVAKLSTAPPSEMRRLGYSHLPLSRGPLQGEASGKPVATMPFAVAHWSSVSMLPHEMPASKPPLNARHFCNSPFDEPLTVEFKETCIPTVEPKKRPAAALLAPAIWATVGSPLAYSGDASSSASGLPAGKACRDRKFSKLTVALGMTNLGFCEEPWHGTNHAKGCGATTGFPSEELARVPSTAPEPAGSARNESGLTAIWKSNSGRCFSAGTSAVTLESPGEYSSRNPPTKSSQDLRGPPVEAGYRCRVPKRKINAAKG